MLKSKMKKVLEQYFCLGEEKWGVGGEAEMFISKQSKKLILFFNAVTFLRADNCTCTRGFVIDNYLLIIFLFIFFCRIISIAL